MHSTEDDILKSTDRRLAECQRVIGYYFSNPKLIETALTHSSLRTPDRECNERLEFLGDSVLGLVITEDLYHLLPDQSEGELTRIKSAVVSRSALLVTSQALDLQRFAEFARGVGKRDTLPASVVANLVEAVIGAIYLDAGYYPAREFVLRHMGAAIDDELNDRGAKNYKSLLQHEAQQSVGVTPTYRTVDADGPDHAKEFVVAAIIRGQEWGRASGTTKKDAEQDAARLALEAWGRRGRGRRRRRKRKGETVADLGGSTPDIEIDLEVDSDDRDVTVDTRPPDAKPAAIDAASERSVAPREAAPREAGPRKAAPRKAAPRKAAPAPVDPVAEAPRGGFGAGIDEAVAVTPEASTPEAKTSEAAPSDAASSDPASPETEKRPRRRKRARRRRRSDVKVEGADAAAGDAAPTKEPVDKPSVEPAVPERAPKIARTPAPPPAPAPDPAPVPEGEKAPRRSRRRSRRRPDAAAEAPAPAASARKVPVARHDEPPTQAAPAPKAGAPEADAPKAATPKAATPKAAPRKASPPKTPTPKPDHAGFGVGIDVPASKGRAPKRPAPVKVKKLEAPGRKRAPSTAARKPKSDKGGFGSGI